MKSNPSHTETPQIENDRKYNSQTGGVLCDNCSYFIIVKYYTSVRIALQNIQSYPSLNGSESIRRVVAQILSNSIPAFISDSLQILISDNFSSTPDSILPESRINLYQFDSRHFVAFDRYLTLGKKGRQPPFFLFSFAQSFLDKILCKWLIDAPDRSFPGPGQEQVQLGERTGPRGVIRIRQFEIC